MRILISGITGFVGGHLTERLLAEGSHAIAGFSRDATWPSQLQHLAPQATLHSADLLNTIAVQRVLEQVHPDWLFHLAGYANTGKSFREPGPCWEANLTGTQSLFDAVARSGVKCRIVFASSGLVYGDPDPGREDLDELATLRPASPYASSKAAADLLAYQVTRFPGLEVLRVRLFNQIGPRQSADFAIANFARQIAAIEQGQQPPILETGDLSAYRDLTDVRDMVSALLLVMKHGQNGEVYNAGRGEVWQIAHVLERLCRLSQVKVQVKTKRETVRMGDTLRSRANPNKLRTLTGWQPAFDIDTTLTDILNDWRAKS